jgi:uncharacterized protein (TIGR00159 family)
MGQLEYLDIGLVALALYAAIVWLRRARAGLAVVGAMLLAAIYLVARELRLELTAWMFQGIFAVFLIVLIVVLQYDLRRLFERVAASSFGANRRRRGLTSDIDAVCATAFELADENCGALIVLPGRDHVERYVEGGERLDGRLSRALLLSLFDPNSSGHDGAVIVEGDLVKRFAVHLPLSNNFGELQSRGTRHSAALGLSEMTDAACIVVSEERCEVSVARDGKLESVGSIDALREMVRTFLEEQAPRRLRDARPLHTLRKTWVDAAVAILLSIGLWQLFISGAKVTRRTITAPVLVDNIDPKFEVQSVNPPEVQVELAGLRRDLYLLEPTALEVRLDASLVAQGQRSFRISPHAIKHPPDVTVRAVSPEAVQVDVRAVQDSGGSRKQQGRKPPQERSGLFQDLDTGAALSRVLHFRRCRAKQASPPRLADTPVRDLVTWSGHESDMDVIGPVRPALPKLRDCFRAGNCPRRCALVG